MPTPRSHLSAKRPLHFDLSDDDAADRYRFVTTPKGDDLHIAFSGVGEGSFVVGAAALREGRSFVAVSQGSVVGKADDDGGMRGLPPFLLSREVYGELVRNKSSRVHSLATGREVEVKLRRKVEVRLRTGKTTAAREALEVRGEGIHLYVLADATWPLVVWRDDGDFGCHLVARGADDAEAKPAKLRDLLELDDDDDDDARKDDVASGPPSSAESASLLARLEAGESLTSAEAERAGAAVAALPTLAEMRAPFARLSALGVPGWNAFASFAPRLEDPGFLRELIAWRVTDASAEESVGIDIAVAGIGDWPTRVELSSTEILEPIVELYRQTSNPSLQLELLQAFSALRSEAAFACVLEFLVARPSDPVHGLDRICSSLLDDDIPLALTAAPLAAVLPRAELAPEEWRSVLWDVQRRLPDPDALKILQVAEVVLRAREDAAEFESELATLYDVE